MPVEVVTRGRRQRRASISTTRGRSRARLRAPRAAPAPGVVLLRRLEPCTLSRAPTPRSRGGGGAYLHRGAGAPHGRRRLHRRPGGARLRRGAALAAGDERRVLEASLASRRFTELVRTRPPRACPAPSSTCPSTSSVAPRPRCPARPRPRPGRRDGRDHSSRFSRAPASRPRGIAPVRRRPSLLRVAGPWPEDPGGGDGSSAAEDVRGLEHARGAELLHPSCVPRGRGPHPRLRLRRRLGPAREAVAVRCARRVLSQPESSAAAAARSHPRLAAVSWLAARRDGRADPAPGPLLALSPWPRRSSVEREAGAVGRAPGGRRELSWIGARGGGLECTISRPGGPPPGIEDPRRPPPAWRASP